MKIRESSATTLKYREDVVKTVSTALPYITSVCVGRLPWPISDWIQGSHFAVAAEPRH